MRLLLVEAPPLIGPEIGPELATHGIAVDICRFDADAWAAFQSEPFPIVVTPNAGASDLCRRIRSLPDGHRTAIIVVTALVDASELDTLIEAGADDIIQTPLTSDALVARIKLASRRQQRTDDMLRDTRAELTRVVGSVSDCLYSAELMPDGILSFRYVSPVAERILGRPAADFLADAGTWLEILHPDDVSLVMQLDAQIREGGTRELQCEVRIMLSDGEMRWVQDRMIITPTERGSLWVDGVLTDITARKSLEFDLSHRAMHDALTELPNRPLFLDRLTHALARRKPHGEHVAVLFIDLDNFKTVNDGLGHDAGDEVLRAVSSRLRRSLRGDDTLARFGGDEFVVLLEALSASDEASMIAQRLIATVAAPTIIRGRAIYLGASIGIAIAGPNDADPAIVLRNADSALYRAKAAGRNRSVVFDPNMTLEALARLELESDLRNVLDSGEGLVLHYQPVFDLPGGEIVGCEALVRWNYPHGGLIGPDVFVPLAEECGLIVQLGEWVLGEACRQLRAWRDWDELSTLTVSVNLSPRHFRDPGLVDHVALLLAANELSPPDLVIEVTEGVLVDERARQVLARLNELGVGISIDDFGTGYSSLHYLGLVDADGLKIDRRYISKLTEQGRESAIVRAILALGESLSLTVTAEGVESTEQMEALIALGCRRVQGFLFGKPVSADDFADRYLIGPRVGNDDAVLTRELTRIPIHAS